MPGFATHYLFGVSTFHRMTDTVFHNQIKRYAHCYALGLQGPDIFFYYLPGYRRKMAPGSVTHANKTSDFLMALIEGCEQIPSADKRTAALCYAAGFLGHYSLDTTCHPYVYAKTNFEEKSPSYFGRHVYLETDIDKEMLKRQKHIPPSDFRQEKTIHLTPLERSAVAHCLYHAYTKVFPELKLSYADMYAATLFMPLGVRVLSDPRGQKKPLIRRLEKKLLGYPYVSPLIPSDTLNFTKDPLNLRHKTWKNPWDTSYTSTDSFYDLLKKAQNTYLHRLSLLSEGKLADLRANLGNCSYSSGLPVD